MNTNMQGVINAIAGDIRTMTETIMDSETGKGNASRYKQLHDSSRKNDMVIRTKDDIQGGYYNIQVLYDSPLRWDRQSRSGRWPPMSSIREWAIAKGLPADNRSINLIRRSIWWNGHAGNRIIHLIEKEINRHIEGDWAERIAEAILAGLH
jgi:hypothetical protein